MRRFLAAAAVAVIATLLAPPAEAQAPGWVTFTLYAQATCQVNADPAFLGYTLQDFTAGNPSTVTITSSVDSTVSVVCPFNQVVDYANGVPIEVNPTATPTPTVMLIPTDTPAPAPTSTPLPADTPTLVPSDTPTTLPTVTVVPTDTPTPVLQDTPTPSLTVGL